MSFNDVVSSMFSHLSSIFPECELYHILSISNLYHVYNEFYDTAGDQHRKDIITRLRNALYRQVLTSLNQSCHHQFLLIKGLLFADDLYPAAEWRDFGDVDIIVKPENYPSIHEALIKLGFRSQFSTDECISRIKLEHIIYSKMTKGIPLVIEVHASALNPTYYYTTYISNLFNRSSPYKDTDILVPCYYDRIIHMLLHFCVHLRDYILESYIAYETMRFNARDLLDIALTIDKYSDRFSFSTLKQYITEINAEVDTSVSWSVFHLLFPNVTLYDYFSSSTANSNSQIFNTAAYLPKRIASAPDISYLYGKKLQSYFSLLLSYMFEASLPLSGHRVSSTAITFSLHQNKDKLSLYAIIKTDPVSVITSRVKLYYLSSLTYPSVRVISLSVTECGIEIKQNGKEIPVIIDNYTISSTNSWSISLSLPLSDFQVHNNCIYINPILEYSIVTQICLFGERWTDIGLWRPIRIPNYPPNEYEGRIECV